MNKVRLPARIFDLKGKFQKALTLHQSGEISDAQKIYQDLIRFKPDHFDSLHLLAVSFAQTGRFQDAYAYMKKAIAIRGDLASLQNNFGNILVKLNRLQEALQAYELALQLDGQYVDAYCNSANTYKSLGNSQEALVRYNRALDINPQFISGYVNRGDLWVSLSKFDHAIADCQTALKIDPGSDIAHNNLGNAFFGLNKLKEAYLEYSRALEINPNNEKALKNKANVLFHAKKYAEAIKAYEAVLNIDPNSEGVYGMYIHSKLMVSDWTDLEKGLDEIRSGLVDQKKVATPFSVLSLMDEPDLHAIVAKLYDPVSPHTPNSIPQPALTKKIKIGYFSADFHNHATAYLMAGFFESINKDLFEIYAFSFGDNDQSVMRSRLKSAFNDFYEVGANSDDEILALAHKIGLHIAVDLKGHTRGSRLGVFAKRLAPIQVSYLGYPGTLRSKCIDYLVADNTLIPDQYRKYYSEKIIYMPHSYQVNDNKRKIEKGLFSRKDCGLPDNDFVYCCFNNNFKITPSQFKMWMTILKSVEDSVLWLLEDGPEARQNLQKMAEYYGVESKRLIFAGRMPLTDHLSRHNCADLFLDTLPYNAHTTASDALSQGLPVLTLAGKSFPARVAASLLKAVNLDELVTHSQDDYVTLAIELAHNPIKFQNIKNRLQENIKTAPLFNTELFTWDLERAYQIIFQRYLDSAELEDINIEPSVH